MDDAGADDLVQGAWLRLLDGNARGARRLGPFLAGVVRQLARRHDVANRRRAAREQRGARPEAQPSAAELAARIEVARKIAAAIGELGEPQRTALLLRYDEGLSAVEIARRQNVSPATVRSRLKRGRDALRERLANEEEHHASWAGLLGTWTLECTAVAPLVGVVVMASAVKWLVATGLVLAVGFGAWSGFRTRVGPALELAQGRSPVRETAVAVPSEEGMRAVAGRPREEAAVESAPAPGLRRSVRGVLVSDGDGSALAHYLVELRDADGGAQRATTDASGAFVATGPLAPGPLELWGIDHPRLAELDTFHHEEQVRSVEEGELQRLSLRVGPTYILSGGLPPETSVGDFVAELFPLGRSGLIGIGFAPLRNDAGLWVRFAPGVLHMEGKGPWRLSVRSGDGLWAGEACVASRTGLYPESVPLEVTPRGRLAGRMELAEGPLLGIHGWVRLEARDLLGPDGAPLESVGELDRGSGTFTVEHLVPGVYTLRLADRRLEPVEQTVEIVPARTAQISVPVAKRADLAPVAGVLRADTPTAFDGGRLWLCESGSSMRRYMTFLEAPGQRDEAEFRFDDVPPGDYVLALEKHGLELVGDPVVVVSGATDLVLAVRVVDAAPIVERSVQVTSRATGAPILYPKLTLVTGDGMVLMTGDEGGLVQLEAPDEPVELLVSADGYRPHWGDLARLDEPTVPISLEPGWGALVRVRSGGTLGSPLPGIVLALDGEVAGTTDENGEARLERAFTPERIGIRADGWRISDLDGDGTQKLLEEVRNVGPLLYLYLEPSTPK